MSQLNDLSRSLVILEQDATLIAVIEMGQSSWLVAGIVPGVERSPLKKLAVEALLKLLNRWREETEKAGHRIERIAVAFEAGRDGFWLARWLRARGIEAHVIHASSVAVSREHRRAKTDRLDTELLKRAVGLDRASVMAVVGEFEPAGVPQHVGMAIRFPTLVLVGESGKRSVRT
jgi:transposase